MQDREKKVVPSEKSQKGYISPIWGEAPAEPISTKICMVCDVHDVIMYIKFHVEIIMGYDFTGGSNFPFSYWFCMGLTTVQRKGAACDSATKAPYLDPLSPRALLCTVFRDGTVRSHWLRDRICITKITVQFIIGLLRHCAIQMYVLLHFTFTSQQTITITTTAFTLIRYK